MPSAKTMSIWTAGFQSSKRQSPVWCHSGDELPDFKSWPGVNLQLNEKGAGGNCVLAELGRANDTQLLMTDCHEKKHFVCEVNIQWDIYPNG
jgi:hypothetical protein